MFSWRELLIAVGLCSALATQAQTQTQAQAQADAYPGIGRAATPKEITAWDIDVRPDFKGLPAGAGSVDAGMQVWESKCASCHGVFGESNEVFMPIVGGTTKEDMKSGRVARLTDADYPGRTTLMKLSSVSTLWDYINRAMPWAQPKSLSTEEVYGVTAYILNMGGIVANDFVLSDRNIAEVQSRLPNRNGKSTDHALWPGEGASQREPDVLATACMNDCATEPELRSFLPEHARNAHGNLAEQNRTVGAQRGADTSRPPAASLEANAARAGTAGAAAASAPRAAAETGAGPKAVPSSGTAAIALTRKHACVACHGMESKIVGPSFHEVAGKYAGRENTVAYLAGKIKAGSSGVWGAVPMPAQALGEADAQAIAQWLADGASE
ncbi:MAG: c-type cytochrome [Methylibium sp.]|uniref:c-type cytochrome n=1 Tax=Methylibium sp. TaxID=2067992 RepID=UPI0017E6049B|nr:c-type cytochrome [Methylibium sp.]MBA3596557.1 c-type cytochrome [Methylibium sp.]